NAGCHHAGSERVRGRRDLIAPLRNSLLMRHSDEIAPARFGPVVWRAELPRVPSEAARRRGRCRAQGAGRQGDVTARMMLQPVGLTTGTTRSFRICSRYQLITSTPTAPATATTIDYL